MNIRKIKMALTVNLMNLPQSDNPLNNVQSVMEQFSEEAGDYRGSYETQRTQIDDNIEQSSHAIEFDRCRLDLDLIDDRRRSKKTIKGFNLYELFRKRT